ncbi:DUF4912 domain-containing protein [Anthocerotibacter panamensis]|uniref:DUF4912 domain-containing protein n=1 Tax=Anthocerotibacter panamensis TaxID=2857077 RepID=UPI001FDA0831|nr:DUF4912 domain-containing protein [Anthocerotibacter panamensis]
MSENNAPLEDLTLRQLRLVAQRYRVSRYSRMTKQELLENILVAQAQLFAKSERLFPLGSQEEVEKAKFQTGTTALAELSDVDGDLGELPGGYGESRIVLLPRDPQWAYAYWDIPNSHKEELRRAGGQQLLLRLYDVTNVYFNGYNAHTMIEFPCDELAREWYVPMPVSDRDFLLEIGYKTASGNWLILARSAPVRVPPMYPSDWVDDLFVSIPFSLSLQGKSFAPYVPPVASISAAPGVIPAAAATAKPGADPTAGPILHDAVYNYVAGFEAQAGSVPGVGVHGWESGIGVSGAGLLAEVKQVPLPSVSLFSGLFSAEFYSAQYYSAQYGSEQYGERKRGFWLVADAEVIFYGATEPDATVTVAGEPVQLNPDGTFRFHYHFPDGLREAPIVAVAADGEQTRSITMRFLRQTPERNTNPKEAIVLQPY